MIRILKDRVKLFTDLLKGFNISDVFDIEELYDEQFHALRALFDKRDNGRYFCVLVLLNGLVSYKLSGTGEDYWWEFSNYFVANGFSGNPVEDIISFLGVSRYNKRFLNTKISRVKKFSRVYGRILTNIEYYSENFLELRRLISRALGAREDSKTVVFSIKMFNYAVRIAYGKKVSLPMEIAIPLDFRILKISKWLGLKERDSLNFWFDLSRTIGIPPPHVDSILWIAVNLAKKNIRTKYENFNKVISLMKNFF